MSEPSMNEEHEDLEMLCLAALPYRGFNDVNLGILHSDELRAMVSRGLGDLAPLRDRWSVVWGPVAYRAPFSLFDAGVVYVVRGTREPHRYVVGIRGTNPISIYDWVLGDLWVGAQAPWPYGDPVAVRGAKISLSTALGLSIIRHMRSAPPRDGLFADLWDLLDSTVGATTRHLGSLAVSLGVRAASRVRDIGGRARTILDGLAREREAARSASGPVDVARVLAEWRSARRSELFQLVADAIDEVGDRHAFDLYRLIEGGTRLRSCLARGVDLVTFLRTAIADARPGAEVTVAGHSKGGALASTVALWLADTQGRDAVPEDQWDPERKAAVRCFSYAGPTAGNAEFAAHSDRTIGERCRRITNPFDIVTLAWHPDDLATIDALYEPGVDRVSGLKELIGVIAEEVRELGYRHVGLHHRKLESAVEPSRRHFPLQVAHQHLAGYLAALDPRRTTGVLDFFGFK